VYHRDIVRFIVLMLTDLCASDTNVQKNSIIKVHVLNVFI
jgi:hypothetical protein